MQRSTLTGRPLEQDAVLPQRRPAPVGGPARRVALAAAVSVLWLACSSPSAPPASPAPAAASQPALAATGAQATALPRVPVRMSYTSTGISNAPAWVAADAGFFDRNGIDAELTYVESATTSLQALVGGSVDAVEGGGSQAVNGALSGADTVILAGLINVLPYKVMVAPEITRGADLRGKRIGISRFGSSSDFGARLVLKHFNLRPEDDTAILQIGGQGARLAALKQGGVDAAVFEPPYNVVLAREGYRELVDTADLNLPYLHVSLFTSRAYLGQNERTLQQVTRAFVEAIAYMKREREPTKQIIAKYTQEEDAEALEFAYDRFVVNYLPRAPYAPLDGVRTLLEEIALTKPEAAGEDPARFVDDRFVRELDQSGFIGGLYR